MGKFTLLIAACLNVIGCWAQHPQSAIGEIYNFEVGDTFEFTHYYDVEFISPPSHFDNLYLDIVIDKQVTIDTILYTFKKCRRNTWSDNIHTSITTDTLHYQKRITFLDSAIFWNHNHIEPGCDSFSNCLFDSVLTDTSFLIGKINRHEMSNWGNMTDTVYADGLGMIHAGFASEDFELPMHSYNLIYYSKANGQRWGTLRPFSLINDVSSYENKTQLQLFPNPAQDELHLNTSVKIDAIHIYSMEGKQLMEVMSPAVNVVDIKALSTGAYIVEVVSNEMVARRRWVKM